MSQGALFRAQRLGYKTTVSIPTKQQRRILPKDTSGFSPGQPSCQQTQQAVSSHPSPSDHGSSSSNTPPSAGDGTTHIIHASHAEPDDPVSKGQRTRERGAEKPVELHGKEPTTPLCTTPSSPNTSPCNPTSSQPLPKPVIMCSPGSYSQSRSSPVLQPTQGSITHVINVEPTSSLIQANETHENRIGEEGSIGDALPHLPSTKKNQKILKKGRGRRGQLVTPCPPPHPPKKCHQCGTNLITKSS